MVLDGPCHVCCSGQLVSQFPYEGAIVRKDLLPQTARLLLRFGDDSAEGCASAEATGEPSDGGVPVWHPDWLPATYDLATEVQFFLKDYRAVCALTSLVSTGVPGACCL